jgi:hypothetical protein
VPRESKVAALVREGCTDLRGLAENCHVMELSMTFHGADERFPRLSQTEAILPVHSAEMESSAVASLMMRSLYLGLVERTVVLCSWMWCPKLMLCSDMAYLSFYLYLIKHMKIYFSKLYGFGKINSSYVSIYQGMFKLT